LPPLDSGLLQINVLARTEVVMKQGWEFIEQYSSLDEDHSIQAALAQHNKGAEQSCCLSDEQKGRYIHARNGFTGI
jgi:hypothetical protein